MSTSNPIVAWSSPSHSSTTLWSIAALLKYWRGVPEVVSTLLLIFIAFQINGYSITRGFVLKDPDPNRPNRNPTSAEVPSDSRLPEVDLLGNTFSISVLIAGVLAVAVGFMLVRTVWGLRLRMLGHNPRTAQRAGVPSTGAGATALIVSGAFAGLAGGVMLTAGFAAFRYTAGFSSNFGWNGLLVALLARGNPIVAVPMAILFAALRTGSGFLAATGVERRIVDVIQAMLLLALLVPAALLFIRHRRRALAAMKDRT